MSRFFAICVSMFNNQVIFHRQSCSLLFALCSRPYALCSMLFALCQLWIASLLFIAKFVQVTTRDAIRLLQKFLR